MSEVCYREPKKVPPVTHVENRSLLCKHDGFLYRPDMIGVDETAERSQ